MMRTIYKYPIPITDHVTPAPPAAWEATFTNKPRAVLTVVRRVDSDKLWMRGGSASVCVVSTSLAIPSQSSSSVDHSPLRYG